MSDAGDRVDRLRKLAGLMLGTSVRGCELRPAHGLDVFLVRLPDSRPVPDWVEGELRLRVLTHGWRLESRERVIAAALDPGEELGDALGVLVGRAVSGLEIARPGLDTTIYFGDLRLRVFPVSTRPLPEGYPAWTLRTSQQASLVVGPGANWGMSGRRPTQQEAAQ